jgi:predicted lipid-binding transport protein (Tim44 family)
MSTMKNWLPALLLAISASLSLAPSMADAKRLGGGGSSGLQRSLPTAPPPKPTAPANPQQAAPTTMPSPAGAAAAATPKRNWLGPVAGLAAGLGLAALMSHLGLGEQFASFLMLALLAMVALVAIRFVMARMGRPQPAVAGGRIEPAPIRPEPAAPPMARTGQPAGVELSADGSTRLAPLGAEPAAAALPSDFDAEGFARSAKTIFIRMQAANDAADLNDLRAFTTPEMFAVARLDIQDRGAKAQATDVVQVEAEVLDVEQQGERQIVSVRFHGKIREEAEGPVGDFDEVWHLQRWSHDPNWKIAGIQQIQAAAG